MAILAPHLRVIRVKDAYCVEREVRCRHRCPQEPGRRSSSAPAFRAMQCLRHCSRPSSGLRSKGCGFHRLDWLALGLFRWWRSAAEADLRPSPTLRLSAAHTQINSILPGCCRIRLETATQSLRATATDVVMRQELRPNTHTTSLCNRAPPLSRQAVECCQL